ERDTVPGGPSASLAEGPPGDPLAPLGARSGRRIGAGTVARLAARVHALRLADDVLAGGNLIGPAFRELGAAVRLYRETSHSEDVGRALLVQIGELAQIAGWIASDAAHHEQAERAYSIGISAARQAGDGPLVAHLAGSLGYQLSNTGREREGLGLALAAVEEAGADAPAEARALFLDRVAWAHTRAGEAQPAVRALGAAHEALSADGGAEAPLWAYWVSREELEVMDARVFTELRRPLRAVPLLTDVLARYDATHAREVALYRSWLAVALADANEPEQAAAEARLVVTASADVASERAAERSRVVLRRLRGFEDVPEVRGLLDEHGGLLAG
ncbi:transcriptional regulator, partial [Streptomyces botrytidirepellens]